MNKEAQQIQHKNNKTNAEATKQGRPEEELTDDGLIKRSFKNWSKLPITNKTALFVLTTNYIES